MGRGAPPERGRADHRAVPPARRPARARAHRADTGHGGRTASAPAALRGRRRRPRADLRDHRRAAGPGPLRPPRTSFDELAEHRLLERRALLERQAHRRPAPGAEPAAGWVHGDFHPLNVLYRGTEPTAIVDWDRLGVQPRAEEAVRAAAIFFVRPCGTLDLAKVAAYAGAYRSACGAGADELAAAVHRVWWERLNDFWMLAWRYQLGDRRTDPQFPAAAALAVWWTREYRAVRDAFTR
ncbi:phosphotransferase [Streptomyces endophytica]|uniref:Phosphotransferase n=1 Tax=Streptomyces endophytica TaxID=2991496 RepID=A0ABY6PAU9_9ACTN|nr:phosphotransferase [Streptomyces endophytica]UZJ30505.1 phosphotransferase [Streptomyces endophytica]